jgi:hypothetical protein
MNGKQFVMLVTEHDIGVHLTTSDLFEIDEKFIAGGVFNNG